MSDEADAARIREWVRTWQAAGPELERLRLQRLPATDTAEALLSLERLFNAATRELPPRPSSGLVEQQRWFQMCRGRA